MNSKKFDYKKYIIPLVCVLVYIFMMYFLSDYISALIANITRKSMGLTKEYLMEFKNLEFSQFPDNVKKYYTTASAIGNLTIYILLFFLFVTLYRKSFKEEFGELQNNSGKIAKYIPLGFLLAFGLQMIFSMITSPLLKDQVSENQQQINAILFSSSSNGIMMIVAAVIFGPVVEELIFRKSIFKLIPNDYLAIAISSILFGLIHTITSGYSITQLILHTIPYAACGVGLGYAYFKSNHNIYVPITIHMLMNCFSTIVLILTSINQ